MFKILCYRLHTCNVWPVVHHLLIILSDIQSAAFIVSRCAWWQLVHCVCLSLRAFIFSLMSRYNEFCCRQHVCESEDVWDVFYLHMPPFSFPSF